MKKGEWIKVEFTGRVKNTGEIFDITSAEEAKKHGIFDPKKKYGPVLIILGAGMIMPGVEAEILKMGSGESRDFDVRPEHAAGPRRADMIRVLSMSKYIREKITPFPGLWVSVDGRNAKVQSVSGGRVRVDFNHPLAGKELNYHIRIAEEITQPVNMVKELLDYYGIEGTAKVEEKTAEISQEKDSPPFVKKLIEETLKKWCPGIENVRFEGGKEAHHGHPGKESAKTGAERKQDRSNTV